MAWASVRAALVPALDAPSKPITTAEQLESDLETSYAAACKLHAQMGFRADSPADSRIVRDVCDAYARVVSSLLFALPEHQPSSRARMIRFLSLKNGGLLWATTSDADAAIACLLQALDCPVDSHDQSSSDDVTLWRTLVQLAIKKSNFALSRALLERSRRLFPQCIVLRDLQLDTLWALGESGEVMLQVALGVLSEDASHIPARLILVNILERNQSSAFLQSALEMLSACPSKYAQDLCRSLKSSGSVQNMLVELKLNLSRTATQYPASFDASRSKLLAVRQSHCNDVAVDPALLASAAALSDATSSELLLKSHVWNVVRTQSVGDALEVSIPVMALLSDITAPKPVVEDVKQPELDSEIQLIEPLEPAVPSQAAELTQSLDLTWNGLDVCLVVHCCPVGAVQSDSDVTLKVKPDRACLMVKFPPSTGSGETEFIRFHSTLHKLTSLLDEFKSKSLDHIVHSTTPVMFDPLTVPANHVPRRLDLSAFAEPPTIDADVMSDSSPSDSPRNALLNNVPELASANNQLHVGGNPAQSVPTQRVYPTDLFVQPAVSESTNPSEFHTLAVQALNSDASVCVQACQSHSHPIGQFIQLCCASVPGMSLCIDEAACSIAFLPPPTSTKSAETDLSKFGVDRSQFLCELSPLNQTAPDRSGGTDNSSRPHAALNLNITPFKAKGKLSGLSAHTIIREVNLFIEQFARRRNLGVRDLMTKWSENVCFNVTLSSAAQRVSLQEPLQWAISDLAPARDPLRLYISLAELKLAALMHHGKLTEIKDIELLLQKTRVALLDFEYQANGFVSSNVFSDLNDVSEQITTESALLTELDTETLSDFRLCSYWTSSPMKSLVLRWLWLTARLAALRLELKNSEETQRLQKNSASNAGQWWKRLEFVMIQLGFDSTTCFTLHESSNSDNSVSELGSSLKQLLTKMELSLSHVTSVLQQLRFDRLLERVQRLLNARQFETVLEHTAVPLLNVALGGLVHPKYKRARAAASTASAEEKEAHDKVTAEAVKRDWTSCLQVWNSLSQSHQTRLLNMFRQAAVQQQDSFVCLAVTMAQLQCCARDAQLICQNNEQSECPNPILSTPQVKTPSKLSLSATKAARETPSHVTTTDSKKTKKTEQVDVSTICDLLARYVLDVEAVLNNVRIDAYPIASPQQLPTGHVSSTVDFNSDLAAMAEVWAPAEKLNCAKTMRKLSKMLSATAVARFQQALGILLLCGSKLCTVPLRTDQCCVGDKANSDEDSTTKASFVTSRMVSAVLLAAVVGARFMDSKYNIDLVSAHSSSSSAPSAAVESPAEPSVSPPVHAVSHTDSQSSEVVSLQTGADIALLACLSAEPNVALSSARSNSSFVVDASTTPVVLTEHQRRLRCCYRLVALMCSAHTLLAANQACRQSQLDADRRILRLWANVLLRHPVIRSAFQARFVDLQSPMTSTQLSLSEIYFHELSRTMMCLHNIELRSSVLNSDLIRQWNRDQQPTIDEPAIEVYHRAHEFCPPGRLSPLFKGVCGVLDASQFDDTYLKFVVDAIIRNAAYLRVRRQIAHVNEPDTRVVLGIPFQPAEAAWSQCLIEHTVLCDELYVHALHVLHSGEEVLKHPTVTVVFDKKPRVECVTAWLRSLSALTSTLPGQSIQMFRPHADDSCLLEVYRCFQGGLHNTTDSRLDGLMPYWPVLKLKDDNKRKLDEVSWTNATDTELAAMSKTERLAIKKARLAAVRELMKTDDGDGAAAEPNENGTAIVSSEKTAEVTVESSQAETRDASVNEGKQKHFLSKIISVLYFYRASESYLSYLLSNFDRLCGRAVTLSFSNQIWPTSLSEAQQMSGLNSEADASVVQPITLHNAHTVYFGPKSRLNMSENDMGVLLSDLKHLSHALLAIWPSSPLPLWASAVRHRDIFESLFQQSTTLSFSSRSMSDSSWQSNFVASQRCTLAALLALQKLGDDQSWKRLPTMLGRELFCSALKYQMLERYAVTEFRAFQIALVDSLNASPISVSQSFAPTHRAVFRAEEVQLLKSMFPSRQFSAESESGLSLLQLQSQRVCSVMHVVADQSDRHSKWLYLLLRARAAEQCGTIEPFQIMEMFSEADAVCPSSITHALVSMYWQRARLTLLSLVKYWIDQSSFQAADLILIALCEWSGISALKPPSQDVEQCVSWMSQTISSDRQSVLQQLRAECRVRLQRACQLLPWHALAHNELAYTVLQAGEQDPDQLRRIQWLLAPFVTLNRRGREGTADDLDRLSPAFRWTVAVSNEPCEPTDWSVLYPWRQNIEQGSMLELVQRLLAVDQTPYQVETETLRSAHLYLELAARRGFSEGATAVHEVWDLLTRRLKLDQVPPISYMLLCARFALLNMSLFLVNPERVCTENDTDFDAAELICPLAVDICIKLGRMQHQLPELVVCAHQMALRQYTTSKCRTVLQAAPVLTDLVSCVDTAVLPMHEHLQLFRGRFDVLHSVGDCRLRECILQSSQWTQVDQLGNDVSDQASVQLLRSDGDVSHMLDVFGMVIRIQQMSSLNAALDWASECRWARKLLPASGAGRGCRTLQQTLSALQNRFAPVLRPLPVDEEMQEIDLLQDESNQQ